MGKLVFQAFVYISVLLEDALKVGFDSSFILDLAFKTSS
ncbi:hypothetical protein NIES267_04890 [Calothrix parasitica NIES-267]|uniref:Uncharacterized protein n=1 Tax=Calothrix parasitica NIES-267 TaxID=1973488 RepID=A0A1Z4LIL3_9CYAN|nr:hypothetical protein NIES267_04890 [Calothrix parasitica NIES-267]